MITYPSLTLVAYPPNAFIFYKIIIAFANIDLMGDFMENDVFEIMNLPVTEPFN